MSEVWKHQESQASAYTLQATLDALLSRIAVLDASGTIVAINEAWRNFSAETAFGELDLGVGKTYQDFCAQAFGSNHEAAAIAQRGIEAVLSQDQGVFVLEYPCPTPTEECWFNLRVTHFFEDQQLRVVLAHTNLAEFAQAVHQRRQAEETQRHHEESFRLLAESVKDYGIFMLDPHGFIKSWNAGAERIKGYKAEEILGEHFSRFYPDEDREAGKAEQALATAKSSGRFETEGWRVRKDGSQFWAHVILSPLYDNSGALRGFAKVTRDMTEHRQATEEILKLNAELEERVERRTAQLETANKELEAFSYSVSHDLRAPLRAVNGFARILLEDYAANLPEEAKDYLSLVRDSARQMGILIDDLLAFSRLSRQSLNQQPVDLHDLVNQVLRELRDDFEGRHVEVQVGALPSCYGDRALLKQLLMNLLSNALKFTRNCAIARINVHGQQEGNELVYVVKDNGAGFDMRYVNKLFGVFQRLHLAEEYEGTGVGLAIVQRVAVRHGGRVWAEGGKGKGASFYFTLPTEAIPEEEELGHDE